MKSRTLLIGIMCLLVIGLPGQTSTARAEPQASYELVQSNIGSGGSGSSGAYSLYSSIGQPAVGQVRAGRYTLGSGIWGGGVVVSAAIRLTNYLPLVIK
jgi:hypothetical protein